MDAKKEFDRIKFDINATNDKLRSVIFNRSPNGIRASAMTQSGIND